MTETQQLTLDDALALAVGLHRDGRLQEAEPVYRAILSAVPDEPDTCHNLGLLLASSGRKAEGRKLLRRAVELRPDIADFWAVHINALLDAGEIDKARDSLLAATRFFGQLPRELTGIHGRIDSLTMGPGEPPVETREMILALARDGTHGELLQRLAPILQDFPKSAFVYKALAAARRGDGDRKGAMEALIRAAELAPTDAESRCNLGVIQLEANRVLDAEQSFRNAIAVDPENVPAHLNLAILLRELGRFDEAESECKWVLQRVPDSSEAMGLLAKVYWQTDRIDAAVPLLEKALAIAPTSLPLLLSSAALQLVRGFQHLAFTSAERAVRLYPKSVAAWTELGDVYGTAKMADDAFMAYQEALRLDPDAAGAKFGLGCTLFALGQAERAEDLMLEVADDPRFSLRAISNALMWRGMGLRGAPEESLALARRWSEVCPLVPTGGWPVERRARGAGRRLRVGYISGDFKNHAVSHFILEILKNHDPAEVEAFGYYTDSMVDEVTGRIGKACVKFQHIAHLPLKDAVELMRNDRLDVLVDLSGHTAKNRLAVLAHRVAPVQAHYLGYFATTGIPAMDYWIGDAVLTPPEHDCHFVERVYRLDRPWIMYRPAHDAPDPEPNTDAEPLTLGSYNRANKLADGTFDVWSKLLFALPQAKLLLKANDMRSETTRKRLWSAFEVRGIDPSRIEIQDATSTPTWRDHMASYHRIDVALDPVGAQGGGTTTCDALWMGVPVVCMRGDRMASRMSASLLAGAGLTEWIAKDEQGYIDRVVSLANDAAGRAVLRRSLRSTLRSSALCNPIGMARSLESAYRAMFDSWWVSRTLHLKGVR